MLWIPLSAAFEHTCAHDVELTVGGISIRLRRRPSPAGTRGEGLRESPLTSPDIPPEADVDVSESGPESLARLQEAPAPSSNEDGLDYNGSSIPLRFFSDDPR